MASPIELYLGVPDVRHVADAALRLQIEAWAHVVDESVVGLEILWMLHECLHDVSAIVLVGYTILGVGIVQIDLERTVCLAQSISGTSRIVVLAYVSIAEGIKVSEILLVLGHRLGHLIGGHLHRGEAITIDAGVRDEDEA